MLRHLFEWIKVVNMTAFLAVWGAILSSITFGWTLYKDLRDKAKIKLSAQLRIIGEREGDGAPFVAAPHLNIQGAGDQLFIVVSVINIGRRRMRWKGLGGTYRTPVNGRQTFIVSARNLPKIREEQEALDEIAELNQEIVDGNLKGIYIWDGSGRIWRVPRKEIKQLKADIEKYVEKPKK